MPDAPALPSTPPNATIRPVTTLTDLDVAALSAKSPFDQATAGPDPGAGSDLMNQLYATWDERRGVKPAAASEGQQPAEQEPFPAEAPRPGKPPALSPPSKQPVAKAKTSADWKAKEEAAEAAFTARLAKQRTEWEASVAGQSKELAELKQWRSAIDIESDPEFQREFKQQYDYLASRVKNIGGEKGKALIDLLSQPESSARDTQIDDLTSDLPDSSKRLVKAVQGSLIELGLRRDAKVNEARTKAASYIERQQQQAELTRLQRKQAFGKVMDEAIARGLDIFAIGTGDAKHDRAATALRTQAESYFEGSSLDDHDRATVALWATLGPEYARGYEALQQHATTLEARLARYESTLPGSGDDANGLTDEASRPRGKDQSQMTHEELQKDMYNKLDAAQKSQWSEQRRAANVYGR